MLQLRDCYVAVQTIFCHLQFSNFANLANLQLLENLANLQLLENLANLQLRLKVTEDSAIITLIMTMADLSVARFFDGYFAIQNI